VALTASMKWLRPDASLRGLPPHRRAASTHRHILRSWIGAALVVGFSGFALFGYDALRVVLVTVAFTFGMDLLFVLSLKRASAGRLSRTLLVGLLAGLTLPATVHWYVAAVCGTIAAAVGNVIFGGWLHPALIGRVFVQFLFWRELSLTGSLALAPVLAPAHMFVGDLSQATRVEHYGGWVTADPAPPANAILLKPPMVALREFAQGDIPADGELRFEPLLRDELPPWPDTLFGAVPGGIGETSSLALIVVGFFLIYRGYLKWQLPVAVLAAAFVAASSLPVVRGGDFSWFPVFATENGRAVGLAYVLYHMTSGQLMIGAFLLGGDVVSSPMRAQGHVIYGIGIGVLVIFMRLYGVLECECYWAILIMNVMVGAIDRFTSRRILGTAPLDSPVAA